MSLSVGFDTGEKSVRPTQPTGEDDGRSLLDVILDLEIGLVQAFGWSLAEIDRTDAVSLLEFLGRFGESSSQPHPGPPHLPGDGIHRGRKMGRGKAGAKKAFIDEVDWL